MKKEITVQSNSVTGYIPNDEQASTKVYAYYYGNSYSKDGCSGATMTIDISLSGMRQSFEFDREQLAKFVKILNAGLTLIDSVHAKNIAEYYARKAEAVEETAKEAVEKAKREGEEKLAAAQDLAADRVEATHKLRDQAVLDLVAVTEETDPSDESSPS